MGSRYKSPFRDIIDAYDAKIKMTEDTSKLQDEMDSLNAQFVNLSKSSVIEQYAFVPAKPRPISYVTANFLHGGWLHLIGNMWFLWLAGFVLEDVWGRWVYSVFYLIAGAAALQFWAWSNPGSITPTLGASGAVAALMGAFLVRFPKMKIEMAWLFFFGLSLQGCGLLVAAALAVRRTFLRIAVRPLPTVTTASGLYHAYLNAINLANMSNGTANTVLPSNPQAVTPAAVVNAIANALQACVITTASSSP